MTRKVIVVPHDPEWRSLYECAAHEILEAWGDEVVNIHHIGSTAVPGLAAKPIIDILVEVKDIRQLDALNPRMERMGYEPRGEYGIIGRRFFLRGGDNRTHHVHAFKAGSEDVQRHLAFRDYLITHPRAAKRYSDLKESLALQYPEDIDSYIRGKHALVEELEQQALAWQEEGGRLLRTLRLHLQTLTLEELEMYARSTYALEETLDMHITDDRDPMLERALQVKLGKMANIAENDIPWVTYWLIVEEEEPFGAGFIGFKGVPDSSGSVEIGYGIDPAVRSRGYTTEAVLAIIGWAFEDPRCRMVTASVHRNNLGSTRVLEKVGMQIISEENDFLHCEIRKPEEKPVYT